MKDLIKTIKNKNFLSVIAIAGIILIVVIFVIYIILIGKKPVNPPATVQPSEPRTMGGAINSSAPSEKVINDLTVPIKEREKEVLPSEETIKSLTSPIKTNNGPSGNSKKNKTVSPAASPISEDIINSLTAPIK